jgi:putative flippase GtrA
MIILIPAYEPDAKLIELVQALRQGAPAMRIVIVNDGSGPMYGPVFTLATELGAIVIGYPQNHGKGQALKTGFNYIAANLPNHGVVCADSDGQHSVKDILRVAEQVGASNTVGAGNTMVLGRRELDGDVPLRSRFGNSVTSLLFGLATGEKLHDTQTGLRGYPASMLAWLQAVPGNRYEYELNLLLRARRSGHAIDCITISTIYLEANESSHFRPLIDSLRIYAPLLKFSVSSLTAFTIDLVAFMILNVVTGSLLTATVAARAISSAVNFTANRQLVFSQGRSAPLRKTMLHYFSLVAGLLTANYALLFLLTYAGMEDVPAKIVTELLLFAISYTVQKRVLFRGRGRPEQPATSRKPGQAPPAHTPDSQRLKSAPTPEYSQARP